VFLINPLEFRVEQNTEDFTQCRIPFCNALLKLGPIDLGMGNLVDGLSLEKDERQNKHLHGSMDGDEEERSLIFKSARIECRIRRKIYSYHLRRCKSTLINQIKLFVNTAKFSQAMYRLAVLQIQ
jgi:hypothetical protein